MQTVEATDQFAITWPEPAMSAAPWVGDRMHFPGPIVQFAQRFVGDFMERVLSAPTVFANGYQFSFPPTIPISSPDVLAGGISTWRDDYSPRIRAFCQRVRNTNYDEMPLPRLVEALETVGPESLDHIKLTMVVIMALQGPTYELLEFLERELGEDGPVLSGTLLQGTRNASAMSGTALDELVRLAAASPELAAAVADGDLEKAGAAPGGSAFRSALDAFLEEYGWRAPTWGAMHRPTWAENPPAVLAAIARYLDDPSQGPSAANERSQAQRAVAMAEVESRLNNERLAEFRELVRRTEAHVTISEDRARWQLSIVGVMRAPALALGRKLVALGALDQPEDVFHLTWDEALRAGREPGPWVRDAARAGRAEYERWERLTPPPFLGMPPDLSKLPPESAAVARHFAGIAMPSVSNGVIRGMAASRGSHTGRARIIRELDEAEKLEPGDVLVCITTAPPWTALFAIAGAVVTNTGGVISHSAICAREFAIPCVVGTQVATMVIPDGAMVTVDGTAGTVTILPS